jgi:hypothetical protein
MIVVIQCAARKRPDAGHLVTASGTLVDFVAHPQIAPRNRDLMYARPDDLCEDRTSWRQLLLKYNEVPGDNALRLYRAYQLYENKAYGRLVDCFGLRNVYILSAGWGLIRADFLTPFYDITFSATADAYKRRLKTDRYEDFRMLPDNTEDDIVFFGGKDYLALFCSLTDTIHSRKIVFFNSASTPHFKGCTFTRFETTTRTNWHYECANALIDRMIRIPAEG